jgi:hypothetical protein
LSLDRFKRQLEIYMSRQLALISAKKLLFFQSAQLKCYLSSNLSPSSKLGGVVEAREALLANNNKSHMMNKKPIGMPHLYSWYRLYLL